MNLTSRPRIFWALGAAISLLFFLLGRSVVLFRPVKIADFALPALRGWNRETKTSRSTRLVSYVKNVGADRLFLKLTWHEKEVPVPKTVQELQAWDAKTQVQMTAMISQMASQFGVSAPVIQRISTQPTTLNGMPALLVKNFFPGKKPTQGQLLLFTNGRNFYDLLANHSAPTSGAFSPDAQAQLDAAWQTLSAALKP